MSKLQNEDTPTDQTVNGLFRKQQCLKSIPNCIFVLLRWVYPRAGNTNRQRSNKSHNNVKMITVLCLLVYAPRAVRCKCSKMTGIRNKGNSEDTNLLALDNLVLTIIPKIQHCAYAERCSTSKIKKWTHSPKEKTSFITIKYTGILFSFKCSYHS